MQTKLKFDFPGEVGQYMAKHPEVYESIKPYLETPSQISPDNPPAKITLWMDGVLCAVAEADETMQDMSKPALMPVDLPPSDDPRAFEVKFDSEVAMLFVDGYEIINRLVNVTDFELGIDFKIDTTEEFVEVG